MLLSNPRSPCVAILCLSSITCAFAQWTGTAIIPINRGQQVSDLAVSSSGKIFAATYNGIYVTTNNGLSWKSSNNALANGIVYAFTVCGTDIFVTSPGTGVLRSSDDGITWTSVMNGLPTTSAINNLTSASGKVYALVNTGALYVSDSKGDSWTRLQDPPGTLFTISRRSDIVYVGTSSGVYALSGSVWIPKNSGLGSGAYELDVDGDYLLAEANGGMFLSIDGGATWSSAPFFRGKPWIHNFGTSLLAISGTSVYISTNGGAMWTQGNSIPAPNSFIRFGSDIYVGIDDGVLVSNNQGVSWNPINTGFVFGRPAVSANEDYVIATNGGKASMGSNVIVSTNGGLSWQDFRIGNTLNVSSVAVKGNTFLASTPTNIYHNKTGSWLSGAQLPIVNERLLYAGENFVYSCSDDAFLRSSDLQTWSQVSSDVKSASLVEKGDKLFAGSIYPVGLYGGVFISKFSGLGWQKVNTSLPPVNSIAYDGTSLVCGTSAGVYISIDDGVTWKLAALDGININSVATSGSKLFAAHKGIEMSADGGKTWIAYGNDIINQIGPNDEVASIAFSGAHLYAMTTDGKVFKSDCLGPQAPTISGSSHHIPTLLTSNASQNQWFLNGNPISGATNTTFLANSIGHYSVQANMSGCVGLQSTNFDMIPCDLPKPEFELTQTQGGPLLTSNSQVGNQWFLNGVAIPGGGLPFLPIQESGSYTLQVTTDNCVSPMSNPAVITGIDETKGKGLVEVFPNPTQNELTVDLKGLNANQKYEIRLLSVMGTELQSEYGYGGGRVEFNVSAQKSGVYIVAVDSFRCLFVKH